MVMSPSVQWIVQPEGRVHGYLLILWTVYLSLPMKVTSRRASQLLNTS